VSDGFPQEVRAHRVEPRIDFSNGTYVRGAIAILDDSLHIPLLVSNDSAVTGGVGEGGCDQPKVCAGLLGMFG
jgi:hypothetical protein